MLRASDADSTDNLPCWSNGKVRVATPFIPILNRHRDLLKPTCMAHMITLAASGREVDGGDDAEPRKEKVERPRRK